MWNIITILNNFSYEYTVKCKTKTTKKEEYKPEESKESRPKESKWTESVNHYFDSVYSNELFAWIH